MPFRPANPYRGRRAPIRRAPVRRTPTRPYSRSFAARRSVVKPFRRTRFNTTAARSRRYISAAVRSRRPAVRMGARRGRSAHSSKHTYKRHSGHTRKHRYSSKRTSHHSKRHHTSKHLTDHRETFYVSGGRKPSPSFKARVEESLSNPVHFNEVSANVILGALTNVDYEPAKWFQPHGVADVGLDPGPKQPTAVTEVPYYLFDYSTVATMLGNMYPNAGSSPVTMKQTIRVSAHMDYILRNTTTDIVTFDVVRWTFKKIGSLENYAITGINTSGRTTDPVLVANPINLIGASIVAAGYGGTAANGLNDFISDARITLDKLPLWNELMTWKQFTIKLLPGKSRKFSIGKKLLEIDTMRCFQQYGVNNYSNTDTWTLPFIPGSTGMLFRMHGTVGCDVLETYSHDYEDVVFSRPQCILQTRASYTAFDWLGFPESQDGFEIRETGILSNVVGNTAVSIINTQDEKVVVQTTGIPIAPPPLLPRKRI